MLKQMNKHTKPTTIWHYCILYYICWIECNLSFKMWTRSFYQHSFLNKEFMYGIRCTLNSHHITLIMHSPLFKLSTQYKLCGMRIVTVTNETVYAPSWQLNGTELLLTKQSLYQDTIISVAALYLYPQYVYITYRVIFSQ